LDSFTQQLLSAIEGYLGKAGDGAQLEIDIQRGPQSQNSDGGQIIVTLKNPGKNPGTPSAASKPPVTNTSAVSAAQLLMGGFPGSTSAASVRPAATDSTPAADPSAVDKSKMSPDDAYWAMQPEAVQALRNMPDDQRGPAAQALAAQGYTIDVPIMVWGWDPLATMVQRQIDGYTWVPSGAQASIPLGPGLTFPGLPAYDATKPPPGSIIVSTDFAIGTNGQNPAMKYVNTATS
jgi:hypothetical protein